MYYLYYISLHLKYRKENKKANLHDRQIPIYWKVPESMK